MDLDVWFANDRSDEAHETVIGEVRGMDLILTSKEDGPTLILDTRQVMRAILGDPD